ncbi:MAG: histidine kinase [Epulopiscium sp.]|nr:histidine kinase [Candidatus Epulonipiscium sp.]
MSYKPFKDFYYSISIKTKLIIVVCLLFTTPILLIGYFGYSNYEKIMTDKYMYYANTNVKELSSLITERIEGLHNFSMDMLYDTEIYEVHKNLLKNPTDVLTEFKLKRDLESYLRSLVFSRPEINLMAFQFKDKDEIYMATRHLVYQSSSTIPMNEMYKKSAGQPNLIHYFDMDNNKVNHIYFARVIYDRNDLQELGLVVFQVNKEYLFGILRDFLKNEFQNVYVYGEFQEELFRLELYDPKEQSKIKGEEYWIHDTIEPLDWKISVSISSQILLKEVRALSRMILLLCLATIPIFIVLINFLYADIFKPTHVLIQKMKEVEQGQIGVTLKSHRKDELGYLFKTFNQMSQKIEHLIDSVYKEQLALKNAEIKALQAQINPHFLYNTLETINWKAQLNGVDEISDMISALSEIMEANIDRENERFISLQSEIDYMDNYIFLIQKRFGSKIQVKKNIDAASMSVMIPKLIIQPLIENAIYHGIEPKGQGTVILNIALKEGIDAQNKVSLNKTLIIEVIDDGVGIPSIVLEDLKKKLKEKDGLSLSNTAYKKSKVGVINVQRRLQLIYGEPYGLTVESTEGEGTRIQMTLPIKDTD